MAETTRTTSGTPTQNTSTQAASTPIVAGRRAQCLQPAIDLDPVIDLDDINTRLVGRRP